jgi:hypothetical protein
MVAAKTQTAPAKPNILFRIARISFCTNKQRRGFEVISDSARRIAKGIVPMSKKIVLAFYASLKFVLTFLNLALICCTPEQRASQQKFADG